MTTRPLPWSQTVSTSTPDADYFAVAPADRFSLRIRPLHDTDARPMAGEWCPPFMKLCVLAHRDGRTAYYWVDRRVPLHELWADEEIRELLFYPPALKRETVDRMHPEASGGATSIPCPI